ncbi:MAG: hypothetical protein S4CHLAM102_05030 [Chlamydiia bacterium]|nr:hypothetical protein [Chlamydiia bacterium]
MEIVRESLFVSAVRSLINAFFAMLGILIGLIVLLVIVGSMGKAGDHMDKTHPVIASDGQGNRAPLGDSAPVILRIDICGMIGKAPMIFEEVDTILYEAEKRYIKHKDRLKAIFLYVDSGGGAVNDSDLIYQAIMRFKEKHKVPVVAYTEGVMASGAYLISLSADKIFANWVGIIGSVGVRAGAFFNFKEFLSDHQVKTMILSAGTDKTGLDPFGKWEEGEAGKEQTQPIQNIIDNYYERFLGLVAEHRPHLNQDELREKYGARVYDAETAAEYGYVDDGKRTYYDVMEELAEVAGIEGKYQVYELVPTKSFVSELVQSYAPILSGKVEHTIEGLEQAFGATGDVPVAH